MNEDEKLLKLICRNAEMGALNTSEVAESAGEGEFKKALKNRLARFEQINSEAKRMLVKLGSEPEELSEMQKMPARLGTRMNVMFDSSHEKISELMLRGSAMGIADIQSGINECQGAGEETQKLAERLLRHEENCLEEMKKYL